MNPDKPMVSVLITAYNREKLIGEAIGSVLAQTYSDFEIIVCDNCSTDNTVNIVKEYMQDKRVKLFINDTNIGQFPNRNKAATHASGKYLKYLDSDDYMYPWGLEILVNCMERFPEAGWGLCSLPQAIDKPFPFQLNSKQAYEYHYLGPGLFHKAPLSSIIKKESFDKVGGFQLLSMEGDKEMWHRMALHFPVVLMPDGMVWYRSHGGQELVSYQNYIVNYERIEYEFLRSETCPLTKEQIAFVIKRRKKRSVKSLLLSLASLKSQNISSDFKLFNYYLFKK